ncbi:hypothetical protein K523DRAFT_422320 [Schizophyllum commune Tattone D]|nr:hypothetical protein K523DRAFT_422320 [Schizophyllum commune Tattone D]
MSAAASRTRHGRSPCRPKKAKSTSNVPRSAPVPSLNAATQARGGWEGMSLGRGAARSAAALDFSRALSIAKSLQIDAKCAEVRAPRSR